MDGDDNNNNDTPVLYSKFENVNIVLCNFQSAGVSCRDRYTLSTSNPK